MRPGNNSGSYYQNIHKHMSWLFQSYNTYRAEMTVRVSKTFKSNWEAHITRANNILNLEIGELARKAQLLNDTSIFTCCQLWIIFRLCSCHYHFARCKDQGSCFWFSNTHNDGGKTLIIRWVYQCPIKKSSNDNCVYLWIVLGVACMERNCFKIQATIQVDGGNNISTSAM